MLPYKGFLANIPVSVFKEKYASLLPEEISGKDFLSQYNISIDTVTKINEQRIYKPAVCGLHPVYENSRVNEFRSLIKNFRKENDKQASLVKLGELMLQSHQSYTVVGLGNEFTDEIVGMATNAGTGNGIFGARITGGGNGGTVCILSYGAEGKKAVKEIYRKYKKRVKQKLFLFTGSSHGAFTLNQYI
jgi:L-arabinokinase